MSKTGRQGTKQGNSRGAPTPPGLRVCRHYVLPRRFMQALRPSRSFQGPNSTISFRPASRKFCLSSFLFCLLHPLKAALTSSAIYQHQYWTQITAKISTGRGRNAFFFQLYTPPDRPERTEAVRTHRQLLPQVLSCVRHIISRLPRQHTETQNIAETITLIRRQLRQTRNGEPQPARL